MRWEAFQQRPVSYLINNPGMQFEPDERLSNHLYLILQDSENSDFYLNIAKPVNKKYSPAKASTRSMFYLAGMVHDLYTGTFESKYRSPKVIIFTPTESDADELYRFLSKSLKHVHDQASKNKMSKNSNGFLSVDHRFPELAKNANAVPSFCPRGTIVKTYQNSLGFGEVLVTTFSSFMKDIESEHEQKDFRTVGKKNIFKSLKTVIFDDFGNLKFCKDYEKCLVRLPRTRRIFLSRDLKREKQCSSGLMFFSDALLGLGNVYNIWHKVLPDINAIGKTYSADAPTLICTDFHDQIQECKRSIDANSKEKARAVKYFSELDRIELEQSLFYSNIVHLTLPDSTADFYKRVAQLDLSNLEEYPPRLFFVKSGLNLSKHQTLIKYYVADGQTSKPVNKSDICPAYIESATSEKCKEHEYCDYLHHLVPGKSFAECLPSNVDKIEFKIENVERFTKIWVKLMSFSTTESNVKVLIPQENPWTREKLLDGALCQAENISSGNRLFYKQLGKSSLARAEVISLTDAGIKIHLIDFAKTITVQEQEILSTDDDEWFDYLQKPPQLHVLCPIGMDISSTDFKQWFAENDEFSRNSKKLFEAFKEIRGRSAFAQVKKLLANRIFVDKVTFESKKTLKAVAKTVGVDFVSAKIHMDKLVMICDDQNQTISEEELLEYFDQIKNGQFSNMKVVLEYIIRQKLTMWKEIFDLFTCK